MSKRDIVMRISCDECGKRYAFTNDELNDYNIYWVSGGKRGIGPFNLVPKLLCPTCTKVWADKACKKGA